MSRAFDLTEATSVEVASVEMGYCFRIPGCGCVVAACVDDPKHARETEGFKKKHPAFVLARLPVDEIRELPWGWPCEHLKAATSVGAQADAPKEPETDGVRVPVEREGDTAC